MRTDRTTLCAECAVRFPAAERCPRCRGTELFDLRRTDARRQALRTLQHGGRGRSERPQAGGLGEAFATWYVKFGIAALTVVAVWLAWRETGSPVATFLLGLAALWGAVALFFVASGAFYVLGLLLKLLWLMGFGVVRVLGARRHRMPWIIAIDDQELLPETGTVEVRGRVRARKPTSSPLAHEPCVAFRLFGQGPLGDVDDAAGVAFDVVTSEGESYEVVPSPASVAIEVEAAPTTVRPDAPLAALLEERGVFPARGPVRLAEALLRDGDDVVVRGAPEAATRGEGYRSTHRRDVLRERPGAPLVIRRP